MVLSSIFIDDYPFPRPEDIPANWTIWNAVRPLWGHKVWEGEWCRGRHYAAIDPDEINAEYLTKENLSLDGHPCRWVAVAEIWEWARAYYAKFGVDPDEFDEDDVIRAYAEHCSEEAT